MAVTHLVILVSLLQHSYQMADMVVLYITNLSLFLFWSYLSCSFTPVCVDWSEICMFLCFHRVSVTCSDIIVRVQLDETSSPLQIDNCLATRCHFKVVVFAQVTVSLCYVCTFVWFRRVSVTCSNIIVRVQLDGTSLHYMSALGSSMYHWLVRT